MNLDYKEAKKAQKEILAVLRKHKKYHDISYTSEHSKAYVRAIRVAIEQNLEFIPYAANITNINLGDGYYLNYQTLWNLRAYHQIIKDKPTKSGYYLTVNLESLIGRYSSKLIQEELREFKIEIGKLKPTHYSNNTSTFLFNPINKQSLIEKLTKLRQKYEKLFQIQIEKFNIEEAQKEVIRLETIIQKDEK